MRPENIMYLDGTPPPESSFLYLPLEIRQQIYRYLLPSTIRTASSTGIAWQRGHTSLLGTCRQVSEECADLLYGENTFALVVSYDRIVFRYRWVLPSGLEPSRAYLFVLDQDQHRRRLLVDKGGGVAAGGGGFGAVDAAGSGDEQQQTRSKEMFPAASPRYIRRIRNYDVSVEHVDSYTGMIKFNCGGPGLTAGLRAQVARLASLLRAADSLNSFRVRLADVNRTLKELRRVPLLGGERGMSAEVAQTVLEPLVALSGARKVEIMGLVTPEFRDFLEKEMKKDIKPENGRTKRCLPCTDQQVSLQRTVSLQGPKPHEKTSIGRINLLSDRAWR